MERLIVDNKKRNLDVSDLISLGFIEFLEARLRSHNKTYYPCIPAVNNTPLECTLFNVFAYDLGLWELVGVLSKKNKKMIEEQIPLGYRKNSHAPGADMTVPSLKFPRVSVKAGKIEKGVVTISSYRTTKYKTLEEKREHISANHQDCTFCLVSNEENYRVLMLNAHHEGFKSIDWKETLNEKGKLSSYKGVIDESRSMGIVEAIISEATSGQLWYGVDLSSETVMLNKSLSVKVEPSSFEEC